MMRKKIYESPTMEATRFYVENPVMAGFFPEETTWDGNIVTDFFGPSTQEPGSLDIDW